MSAPHFAARYAMISQCGICWGLQDRETAMRSILVSGASGIVGYGILRSLRKSGLDLHLIGTTMYEDSPAQAFCDTFERAPPTSDAPYISWLSSIILKHDVALIVPGIEADMYRWLDSADELVHGNRVKLLLNQERLVALCRDKWIFFEALAASGLPCAIDTALDADFEWLASRFGLPFLLKPRRGFGGRGIVRVESEATFTQHRSKVGPLLMAQPIIGSDDEEFSTSVFADGRGGFYAGMTLRRRLSDEGFTDRAEVVRVPQIDETIHDLCRLFLPVGPTNFQFRTHQGALRLLEINPRISSATSIRTAFGYNESAMAVEYFLDGKMPRQPEIRQGRAIRYTEDLIFYS